MLDATLPDDLTAELLALRARAYGPGTGLSGDPSAATRLAELERMLRGDHLREPVVAVLPRRPDEEPQAAAAARAARAATPSVSARRRFRLRTLSAAVAIVVAGATLLTGAFVVGRSTAQAPSDPVARLQLTADAPATADEKANATRVLEQWGGDVSHLRVSERFGNVAVWTAPFAGGGRCAVLTWATSYDGSPDYSVMSVLGGGCAPAGQDPVFDMQNNLGTDLSLPDEANVAGAWLRFSVHGDTALVWITVPEATGS
ncbi:hypothetical protein ET475_14705 [Microbacterium protaetiae]|uniref:Uncharacterized protein n=1 Tax=Microbacterium protaetiae TaxID=2509458 RepID=A0A4P6ELK7_9MICO|nr:hypothetical protein [Microbacterium protaetiae]QAY61107.1 hypothetical protein ET475_14705 [Microbacterium protaetiae]